jgi:periplasmic copper chaperone A
VRLWPLLLASAASGCHRQDATGGARVGDLRISEVFAFEPVTRDEAAVYFKVRNTGDSADSLIGASAEGAGGAMIHGPGSGRAMMRELGGFSIPAHSEIRLEPGGLHLMLMGLDRIPRAGERLDLSLAFQRAGRATIEAPVRPYGQ